MLEEQIEWYQPPNYQQILEHQDFFPKIFLLPTQVKLQKDKGLMIIQRNSQSLDTYQMKQINSIDVEEQQMIRTQQIGKFGLTQANQGLLSLFKATNTRRRIKIAICACVYSQPKHMLKNTIKGIQQSFKHFRTRAGILPHQIILVIIFDGIEKINSSSDQTQNMMSFFNQIDIKNNFKSKPYGKSLQQFLREQQNRNTSRQVDQQQFNLFTEEQLSKLHHKLFETQYQTYMRTKELLNEVEIIKKSKNIRIEQLPIQVLKKYEEICKNYSDEQKLELDNQDEIQEYLLNKKNLRLKLIYEALNCTSQQCNKYLNSRQQTSIVYPARFKINDFSNPKRQKISKQKEIQQNINDQFHYVFFCVKHKNQGKLSSHLLFFQGFCKLFDPQYCILTDCGVKPKNDAIYKMWVHMEKTPKCGGVCGYMGLKMEKPTDDLGYRDDGYNSEDLDWLTRFSDCFFSVQRAQQFEYHYAHMLDKPFQSAFGYIHVLPGAFSGYRWKTLKNIKYKAKGAKSSQFQQTERNMRENQLQNQSQKKETLMQQYLKIALGQNNKFSLEDANMYLAQDRILCLGMHTLGYDLHYLPDAESTVDPVTSLTKLMGQRRRWINGSWFAFSYVWNNKFSGKTCLFYLQILYYTFVHLLSWFSLSLFYVIMNLTVIAFTKDYIVPIIQQFFIAKQGYELSNYTIWIFNVKNISESIPDIINFIYILLIGSIFLHSLLINHNNPQFKKIYYFGSSLLGVYGLLVFALMIVNGYTIFRDTLNLQAKQDFIIPLIYLRSLIFFVLVGHSIPILWTFSPTKYVQMLLSVLSYVYYTPTYINILQVFSFCRIDDLSWGTKGLDSDQVTVAKQWQKKKIKFVLQYLLSNIALSFVLIRLTKYILIKNTIILATTILVAFLLGFRLIFAAFWLLRYYSRSKLLMSFDMSQINRNRAESYQTLQKLKKIEQSIKNKQRLKTKQKKQQQFKKRVDATSQLLQFGTTAISARLKNRIAEKLVRSVAISKKQLVQTTQRMRTQLQQKMTLFGSKNLSNSIYFTKLKTQNQSENIPKSEAFEVFNENSHKFKELKGRIQKMKKKRKIAANNNNINIQ